MKLCRHMDFEQGKFLDCELVDISKKFPGYDFPILYWERRNLPYEGAPKKVQFCKQRGRINDIFSCYNNELGCLEEKNNKEDKNNENTTN